jgi:small GTP-binding protein
MRVRKVLLLGEVSVGKTSIARRLAFNVFATSYKPTIEFDVYRYAIEPPLASGPFQFLVFDTDGTRGRSLLGEVGASEAHAAMVVADVTEPRSVDTLLMLADAFAEEFPGRYSGLVLNKIDLAGAGEVAALAGRLRQDGHAVHPTSALTGENVGTAFREAAESIVRRGL